MRQIKFRAWDESRNRMIYKFGQIKDKCPELLQTEEGIIFCSHYQPNGDWCEPLLMQYIGRKDKKGEEIFEGDILVGESYSGLGGKSTKSKEFIFSISYSEITSRFIIDIPQGIGKFRYLPNIYDCKVIGNIYESPQLLNQK